jgi:hypothetical protein
MVLRSAILESLQLDKQYCVRLYWSRYNWTKSTAFGHTGVVTVGQTVLRSAILESLHLDKNGEITRQDSDIFSMQMSRPNHTSLFRLEPKCHRSGRSDLSRTAEDCGVTADEREPDYRKWRSDRLRAAVAMCLQWCELSRPVWRVSGKKQRQVEEVATLIRPASALRSPYWLRRRDASRLTPALFWCYEKTRERQTVAEAVR